MKASSIIWAMTVGIVWVVAVKATNPGGHFWDAWSILWAIGLGVVWVAIVKMTGERFGSRPAAGQLNDKVKNLEGRVEELEKQKGT